MSGPVVVACGAATSLGDDLATTAASVRANLTRFVETHIIDRTGEPAVASPAPYLPDPLSIADRCTQLGVLALEDALGVSRCSGGSLGSVRDVPLVLGCPLLRPSVPAGSFDLVLSRLLSVSNLLSSDRSHCIGSGHAAGLAAITVARQMIEKQEAEFVVAGGADSYFHPDCLAWLDESGRLHSDANPDGFVPGEAAGFCVLAESNAAGRLGLRPLASILAASVSEESNPLTSDGVCIGEGLTRAVREVLIGQADHSIDWTICDLNGESFRAYEWMYAYLRNCSRHRDPLEIWHPADCYGDIGAASGPVLVGLALRAWARGYARGARALVWASSDSAARAAVLLRTSGRTEYIA